MSALAMILTAAMAVPGDGPQNVSAEMVRERQSLKLNGPWKAVVYWRGNVTKGQAAVFEGQLQVTSLGNNNVSVLAFGEAIDEGGGNLRLGRRLGIYEHHGDRLRICIGSRNDDPYRPTSFRAGDKQWLIELSRIQPTK